MSKIQISLKKPIYYSNGCVDVFNKIIELAPNYNKFHCGHLINSIEKRDKEKFAESCIWFPNFIENHAYNDFLLEEGYAMPFQAEPYWIVFTDKGREMKSCGSLAKYEELIIERKETESAIRRLSVTVPISQMVTNSIMAIFMILSFIVSCQTCHIYTKQYEQMQKEVRVRIANPNKFCLPDTLKFLQIRKELPKIR